jgi:hypothetical protein
VIPVAPISSSFLRASGESADSFFYRFSLRDSTIPLGSGVRQRMFCGNCRKMFGEFALTEIATQFAAATSSPRAGQCPSDMQIIRI